MIGGGLPMQSGIFFMLAVEVEVCAGTIGMELALSIVAPVIFLLYAFYFMQKPEDRVFTGIGFGSGPGIT
jgi:hypothetical protein